MSDDVLSVVFGSMNKVKPSWIEGEVLVDPFDRVTAADKPHEEHPLQGKDLGIHDGTIVQFWLELDAGIIGNAVDHLLNFIPAHDLNRLPTQLRGDVFKAIAKLEQLQVVERRAKDAHYIEETFGKEIGISNCFCYFHLVMLHTWPPCRHSQARSASRDRPGSDQDYLGRKSIHQIL